MIDLSKITRVYSGKVGKCCCGCSGKYSENPRQIKRIAKILEENADKIRMQDEQLIAADIGGRTCTVYFD